MLIIAHRGAKFQSTENSLSAFRKAIEIGADMIELDVQLTRDGELIVLHDPTLDRTTNGHGLVADMTLDEIHAFVTHEGEKLPTLSNVFSLCKGKIQVLVEIKAMGCLEKIAGLINEFGNSDEVVVQSFLHVELARYRQYDQRTRMAALFDEILMDGAVIRDYLASMNAQGAAMKYSKITPRLIQKLHEAGQFIYAWGLTEEERPDVEKLGVDGLILGM